MLLASTSKQIKPKRPRVKSGTPIHYTTVDSRLKKIQAELGLTKFELKWIAIQNEFAKLNK